MPAGVFSRASPPSILWVLFVSLPGGVPPSWPAPDGAGLARSWLRWVVVRCARARRECGPTRVGAREACTTRSLLTVTAWGAAAAWPGGRPARGGPRRRPAVPAPASWGRAPPAARGLDGPPGGGVLAEPVVDPAPAHAARGHERGHRGAVRPGRAQRVPQRRVRPARSLGM